MQAKFPKELGPIHLNLFGVDNHLSDDVKAVKCDGNEFDFISVVQSCELVQSCILHNKLYEKDVNQFRWVNEALLVLRRVLYEIYNNEFYDDVQLYAEESIHKHPICHAWKRAMSG